MECSSLSGARSCLSMCACGLAWAWQRLNWATLNDGQQLCGMHVEVLRSSHLTVLLTPNPRKVSACSHTRYAPTKMLAWSQNELSKTDSSELIFGLGHRRR